MASPVRPSQENPSSISALDSREGPSNPFKSNQLKTPHDAAIAGVTGRLSDLGGKLQALSGFGSKGTADKPDSSGQESGGDVDYGPWDGQIKGRLIPVSVVPGEGSHSAQMWSHLATVRKLQAELASAHIAMEHVGEASSTAQQSGSGQAAEDDTAEMDAKFKGQQAAIEGIMSKLDELSKAVTSYHNVPTPQLDLFLSRSNTASNDVLGADLSDFGSSPRHSLEQNNVPSPSHSRSTSRAAGKGPAHIAPITIPGRVLDEQHIIVQSPSSEKM